MASRPAFLALSFVFSVLFFSQAYAGSRVTRLMCFDRGVAPVWFNCDWFFVCDRKGVSPLFEKCNWLETFDLGSMRCQAVKDPDQETVKKGFRSFPCRPWPGTDEQYWFGILKVIDKHAGTDDNIWIWFPTR